MKKVLSLSKYDVVKKQLEVAIKLYFNDDDPISIHTLTCAAHGILSDLNKKNNGKPMIISDSLIADRYKIEWNKRLKKPQNFFKHADRDTTEKIDFVPEITQYILFDAIIKYHELTNEIMMGYFLIYKSWFMAKNINFFNISEKDKALTREISTKYGDNRKLFFNDMLYVTEIYKKYTIQ